MCGRFALFTTVQALAIEYQVEKTIIIERRYNIAPSQDVLTVVNDGSNKFKNMRWGFIPHWAKDEKIGFRMINARSETVKEKPAFGYSFRKQRCIIPADGFYEWKKLDTKKQPMFVKLKNNKVMSMAGLWTNWTNSMGEEISSCTILTKDPNPLMKNIHDRMPVIIEKKYVNDWLDVEKDVDIPGVVDSDDMEAYSVSEKVGSYKNQGASLIKKVN